MAADHFTVPTREWAGDAKRTLVQGLHIHKSSGWKIAHQADDVAGQREQDVVVRCHKPDGEYAGAITLKGVGHGSSVGLYSTGADTMELWLGSEKHNAVVKVGYRLGDRGVKAVTRTVLPKGDVSIDKSEDLLCLRNGDRFRGYRFSAARAGKVQRLWEFTIPDWGKRFQGHLIVDGRLFVHRDIETGGASRVHVFDYPSGNPVQWIDTTDMGDEAEGCVEIDDNLAKRFSIDAGIYAVKRTGGTGPSRVIEASRLPVKPPAPKRLTGVDVSSHQAGWVPATGDSFVMVKATEGTGYKNPERAAQLTAGRDKGLLVGHYHWLTPGRPLEQAAYFVANADIRASDMLWCDWEKQTDGTHPTIQDVAAFIAEVQRLVPTSRVGLYCNRNDWTSTAVKAGDGLWIAQYGATKPGTSTDWVFWQWTDKPIDQNVSRFTSRADLEKWAKVNRKPPVVKPPVVVKPDVQPPKPPAPPVVVPPPVVLPSPQNVGLWAVDPAKVSTVLLGRQGTKLGNELSPATTITDGVEFVKNNVGRYALLRSDGWSYDREHLVQIGAGPVPVKRDYPIIPDYDTTERIRFRGGLACRCVAISLPWVEFAMLEADVIKFNIDCYQFGYRNDVSASAGTHAKGGNTDVGQYTDAALKVWRAMGWTMQRRTTAQGFSDAHGHGWPKGCTHLSAGAEVQRRAWDAGRDGLRQNRLITGPAPKGKATPKWDAALSAYLKKIGAPPVKTT